MKMKKYFFALVVTIVSIFMFQAVSSATSISTKIFTKDLNRFQQHIAKQQKLIIKYLEALTEDDIKIISYNVKNYKVKPIDNFDIEAIIEEMSQLGYYGPKNVKSSYLKEGGLLSDGEKTLRLIEYGHLLKQYKIPKEDFDEALTICANFSLDLLDKIQVLMEKANAVGMTGLRMIRLNDNSQYYGSRPLFLFSNENNDQKSDMFRYVYTFWADRQFNKIYREIFSNHNILKAHKMWLEFILSNDFAYSYQPEDEVVMKEIEKIEKRLTKLTGGEKKKQEAPVEVDETKSTQPSTPASKGTFKLDLPE